MITGPYVRAHRNERPLDLGRPPFHAWLTMHPEWKPTIPFIERWDKKLEFPNASNLRKADSTPIRMVVHEDGLISVWPIREWAHHQTPLHWSKRASGTIQFNDLIRTFP